MAEEHSKESSQLDNSITSLQKIKNEIFTCDDCTKTFLSKQQYFLHRKKHIFHQTASANLDLIIESKCSLCSDNFHLQELQREFFQNQDNIKRSCDICDEEFSDNKAYSEHLLKLHEVYGFADTEMYSCCVCYTILKSEKEIKVHLKKHDIVGSFVLQMCQKYVLEYKCFECGNKESALKKLIRHSKNLHKNHRCLKCLVCSNDFSSFWNLQRHVMVHKGRSRLQCTLCPKTFSDDRSLRYHVMKHTGSEPFSCKYCDKRFSVQQVYQRHLQIHLRSSQKPFKCNVCKKGFSDEKYLKYHKMQHEAKQPYACQHCDKKFAQLFLYNNHIKKHISPSNKAFQCPNCPKSFVAKRNLEYHLFIHTGERPFACDICCRTFTRQYQLKTHIKTHDGNEDENLKCNVCSKHFCTKQALRHHQYVHTGEKPFVCPNCNKGFRNVSDMKSHIQKIHNLIVLKPYNCDLCDQKYATKRNLKYHMMAHSGEKPYFCEICGKAFNRPYNLQSHLKIHYRYTL